MAYKSEAAYKVEFNALVVGATAMLERASQVRVNLGKIGKRGNKFATGPVATSVKTAVASAKAIKTFKGEGERNPSKR